MFYSIQLIIQFWLNLYFIIYFVKFYKSQLFKWFCMGIGNLYIDIVR